MVVSGNGTFFIYVTKFYIDHKLELKLLIANQTLIPCLMDYCYFAEVDLTVDPVVDPGLMTEREVTHQEGKFL